MPRINLKKISVLQILFTLTLAYLLWWRMRIGLNRFFDVDEFSYLHWVVNFAKGQRPYIDYFLIFPPGFLWAFAPLWWLFGGVGVFVAARVASIAVFFATLGVLGYTYARLRGLKYALLPVIILAFLPMPYDKLLEFRPDNLSTLFALVGTVVFIEAIIGDQKSRYQRMLLSGILHAASLVVFPKALPFTMVTFGVLFAITIVGEMKELRAFLKHPAESSVKKLSISWFVVGFLIPAVLTLLYLLMLGDPAYVLYSVLKLPFETTFFGGVFEAHLFFFPNGSFYGGRTALTGSFLANHTFWTIGLLTGVLRILTPHVAAGSDKKRVWAEVLLGWMFMGVVMLYVMYYPLKHSQYLIPVAFFVAFYAADGIQMMVQSVSTRLEKTARPVFEIVVFAVFGLIVTTMTVQTNTVKLGWFNNDQLRQVRQIRAQIPEGSRVLDLEGRLVFWPDAYYICCVPFGEYLHQITHKPQPLMEVLEEEKIPYLWQADTGRIYRLPMTDRVYIQNNYYTVHEWGDYLWIRNGETIEEYGGE